MINETYFQYIDTVEKAYWLGFLYADVFVLKNHKAISLNLSIADEDHLDKFILAIDGDITTKRYHGPYKTAGKSVHFYLRNEVFVKHLIAHGCYYKKSHIIRFPEINTQTLNNAFLLGYYDGDGTAFTSDITCGSRLFLEDIQKIYALKTKIQVNRNSYTLALSTKLLRTLLSTYVGSLARKRLAKDGRALTDIALGKCNKQKKWYGGKRVNSTTVNSAEHKGDKLTISKLELESLIWKMPTTLIGKKFGVTDNCIARLCRIWQLPKPPRGYWAKYGKSGHV